MNNQHATAGSPLTCPKCQSFAVREVSLHGDDLHGFSCHDCRHVFYLRAADLQRERDKMRGTVRPRQPKSRSKLLTRYGRP